MNETTKDVIQTGKAYVQVIRGFKVLEPKAKWFERMLIKLLRKTYQQRLRYLIVALPTDIGEQILKGE